MAIVASTHSRAVAAAGNYDAAGDILSNSATNGAGTAWQFPSVGQWGVIRGGVVTCSEDSVVFRLRLHLFADNPSSSELDDNAALAIAEADRPNHIGFVDFPAMTDVGVPSVAQFEALKPYHTKYGTLYGILQTLDVENNETAGMTVSVTLYVDKV